MTTEHTTTGFEFSVVQSQGTVPDKIVVDSDRVLIGSGPHCEIRLPPDQAAAEHVLILMRGGAVYAQARAVEPRPLLNGAPFSETPVEPGARLQIGPAVITVSLVEVTDVAKAVEDKSKDRVSPLTYVLAAITVPVCIFILLDDSGKGALEPKPAEAPALWAADPPKCTQSAQEQARAVAQDKMIVALGRRERSPFDVRDGVLAVPLFYLAADCFRVAGEGAKAEAMTHAGERLQREMDESYRAHQMRLEHSIDINQLRTAQRETDVLLRMLEGQTGPYVVWLSNLDRQLKVKLGKDDKK